MNLITFNNGNQTVKNTTRLAGIFCLCISIAFISATISISKKIEQVSKKMLVIDTRGQIYNTDIVNSSTTRIFEYKNHVKMFYTYWYSFDENNYKEHIEAGLQLIGDRGKELFNEYKDQQVEKILSEKNLHYDVKITNIAIDMNTIPVSGHIEGIQTGKRARGSISRKLSAKFTLDDVSRSEENMHGCKIITWDIYESSILNDNTNE